MEKERQSQGILAMKTVGDRIFDVINCIVLTILALVMLYPLLYVVFCSFSDADQLTAHTGLLFWPVGYSLKAYESVLSNYYILTGYRNTVFILLLGVPTNLILTTLGAFVLSRRELEFRRPFMLLIMFTMYFSGGMIPSYFNVKDLGLMNTYWALILPGAISTVNLIIMRTSFESIPPSLEESARIDGAGDFTVLTRIVLPLSKAVVAVMVLYYGVGHWNSWFSAAIYLNRREMFPLQLILREILVEDNVSNMMSTTDSNDGFLNLKETIKYATTVVATVPILCVYPFIQKYFVKGVMIGAVKG